MTPAHHRTIFAIFAVLVAGVAVNVLLMQPAVPIAASVRPAVSMAANVAAGTGISADLVDPTRLDVKTNAAAAMPKSAQMEQGPRRFARLRPDAAQANRPGDTLPDAPDAEGDTATISAVQRELAARGYGKLTPDGVPGLVTRAAIMAYEHDNQLPLKGEASATLLARIVLGSTGAATPDPAAGRVRSAQAEIVMRTVQQSLAALGYQVGKIDGRAGDDIGRAIREFELDEGLKPTGRVSAEVFTRLGRVVASAKPKPIQ